MSYKIIGEALKNILESNKSIDSNDVFTHLKMMKWNVEVIDNNIVVKLKDGRTATLLLDGTNSKVIVKDGENTSEESIEIPEWFIGNTDKTNDFIHIKLATIHNTSKTIFENYDLESDAREAVVTRDEAEEEINKHNGEPFIDFLDEVGDKETYTGEEVLNWLGY